MHSHTFVRQAPAIYPQFLHLQKQAKRATTDAFADSLSDALVDPQRFVVLAEEEGVPVGWATTKHFSTPEPVAPAGHYLMGMTVSPDRRCRGIGTSLVSARMSWIRKRADAAVYFANAANAASIRSHRSWAFVEIARDAQFRDVKFSSGSGILFRAEFR